MDESFMSTSSFDEDSFVIETLNNTSPNCSRDNNNKLDLSSDVTINSIDISALLTQPVDALPKAKLEFNESETPRNTGVRRNQRKRKNFARRCLTTDMNGDFSLNSEDDQISFQDFRQTKESKKSHGTVLGSKNPNILSSIENTLSPKSNKKACDKTCFELTPEFDTQKCKGKEIRAIARVPLKATNQNSVPLQKSFSENHASIMRAIQVSSSDPSLIGDFSMPYSLPLLTNSKHQDLKSISCHVLADLLRGRYCDIIEQFTIIDCRYPYEYQGGHIQTALNIFTQEQILNKFIANRNKEAEPNTNFAKRNILIFHCEFSSERGPGLSRFLRNKDRVKNSRVYPSLFYPEIYLLEGGYKEFYNNYSNLCVPCSYTTMNDKQHENDLRKYRTLVKTHSFDSKFSTYKRNLRL